MVRRVVALTCMIGLLVGCSSGGDEPAATPTTEGAPGAPAHQPDPDVFCDRMNTLSTEVQPIEELRDLYDDLLRTSPTELTADVEYFVRHSRAVSEAFADAGAPEREVDVEAVLATLGPDTRAFLEEMAASAENGQLADGPVGAVMGYSLDNC